MGLRFKSRQFVPWCLPLRINLWKNWRWRRSFKKSHHIWISTSRHQFVASWFSLGQMSLERINGICHLYLYFFFFELKENLNYLLTWQNPSFCLTRHCIEINHITRLNTLFFIYLISAGGKAAFKINCPMSELIRYIIPKQNKTKYSYESCKLFQGTFICGWYRMEDRVISKISRLSSENKS